MAYYPVTRKFTIEIEVSITAHVETGGGYADEPPWSEVTDIEIDTVDVGGVSVLTFGNEMKNALRIAAYKEMEE